MTRPQPHPEARGICAQWVSTARMWSATTKRLLTAGFNAPGERMLAVVSFYLCLRNAYLAATGLPHIPADPAASSFQVDLGVLRRLRDRMEKFRDEVMHFAEKDETGRQISMNWSSDPPTVTYMSSIGRETISTDSITEAEIRAMLARLDPWIDKVWERNIGEEMRPDADELAAKIEAFTEAFEALERRA